MPGTHADADGDCDGVSVADGVADGNGEVDAEADTVAVAVTEPATLFDDMTLDDTLAVVVGEVGEVVAEVDAVAVAVSEPVVELVTDGEAAMVALTLFDDMTLDDTLAVVDAEPLTLALATMLADLLPVALGVTLGITLGDIVGVVVNEPRRISGHVWPANRAAAL